MPTSLRRHTLSETPDIARALDRAAEAWPDLAADRAALLRRLVEAGYESLVQRSSEIVASRREAIQDGAGSAHDIYPPAGLQSLKTEWPE